MKTDSSNKNEKEVEEESQQQKITGKRWIKTIVSPFSNEIKRIIKEKEGKKKS